MKEPVHRNAREWGAWANRRTSAVRGTTQCARCVRCWRASDSWVNGRAEGSAAKGKNVERVVEQGEKALLVHGALPRKPLFVLHPFARSLVSERENEGTRNWGRRGRR